MKMKLCIIMSMLMCLGIVKMNGQVRLGVEAGVNMTSLGVRGNHAQIVPVGGLVVDYQFENNMIIQSGLHYVMKGANSLVNGSKELMVRLGYIELPVMVGYRLPVAEHIYMIPQMGGLFCLRCERIWGIWIEFCEYRDR